MADDDTPPEPKEGLDQRVSSLETGQETLSQKLDRLLHLSGDDHTEEPTDPKDPAGGTNIAHEIRQQLDQRDADAKRKADEDGLKSTVAEVQTKLSELTEKPPEPMPRRVEKFFGWR
jgi:hypothetical protein